MKKKDGLLQNQTMVSDSFFEALKGFTTLHWRLIVFMHAIMYHYKQYMAQICVFEKHDHISTTADFLFIVLLSF